MILINLKIIKVDDRLNILDLEKISALFRLNELKKGESKEYVGHRIILQR